MEVSLEEWLDVAPRLETDWTPLLLTYRRSLVDLAALRFYPRVLPDRAIPAAGLPWFMTIFGRDSLITSYPALPFTPELAETTLQVLAARQGRRVDDFRDEEPGRILHEIRYGSSDATPLFLVLLDEVERWTGTAFAMLEAANYFLGRLPEAFAGYPRTQTRFPVEYPTACSPQAWATGAPLALLRALRHLEPAGDLLLSHPFLPGRDRAAHVEGYTGSLGSRRRRGDRAR